MTEPSCLQQVQAQLQKLREQHDEYIAELTRLPKSPAVLYAIELLTLATPHLPVIVTGRVVLDKCKECEQVFVKTRPDREFCSESCSNRFRQRMWRTRQKDK